MCLVLFCSKFTFTNSKLKNHFLIQANYSTLRTNNNIVSVKSARAMWKVHIVQNYDNDILEGFAVANPPKIQNPKPIVS
jgi:uncharacterized protein YbcV (DUF1398 family)